jgi:predicted NBD/HSP70 family sugar kinase
MSTRLGPGRMHAGGKSKSILVIDVGGTHVKIRVSGDPEERKIPSGLKMTARKMVRDVKRAAKDWKYDAVSIGYPGPVLQGRPLHEPQNLGAGWMGFDFRKAFGRPVKVINDAAMQAIGSYRGGRMLFLGLGTGLGSAMVIDGILEPMELAHLPYKKGGKTYEDYVGARALKKFSKKKWRRHVVDVVERLKNALGAEYVVLGGGNAKHLVKHIQDLPAGTRLGDNRNAFLGGFRLWESVAPYRSRLRAGA